VLFVALQSAFAMRTLRSQIETDALEVLSTSQFVIAHDWPRAEARVAAVQHTRRHWKTVILTDVAAGREICPTLRVVRTLA
jgi:hypothetical protein